jgi:hypothetical protein
LTEVAVDGVTITGNGTEADPLVAVGGGGGTPLITKEEGTNVSTNTTTLNFTGEGVAASLTSPGVVEVNIPGGSGTTPDLQEVTDEGNSTTNDIAFTGSAGLSFDNGAFFRKGTTDAGNGGAKGTAQICSISYELKWEAGRLYYMQQDGFTIRDVTHNFTIVPQVTDDSTKGFVVGSRWSLDDGTVYLCSDDTIGAAVWAVVTLGGVTSVTGTAPISSSGGATPDISITQADGSTDGYLTSTDWNTFDGKFDVPTGTNADYLDGTGTPTPFPALPTGTVTSVDLTMPVAFTVTGNPITTSGTLAVSANGLTTQYIRGDGQLANFPTSIGGGSSVSYYLNGSVNQGTIGGSTYYEMSKTPILGAGTDFTRTNAQGNGLIAQFITDAGDPNLLAIPAGNWNLELFFSSSASGGSPSFYVELYKYDGATFTLIASDSATPEGITNGTTIDAYFTALAVPATTLALTDRLALRVFVTTSGKTIKLHTENGHLCQVITTFSTGLNSLNGLTEQVQNFAVGTGGTDFGISSATGTHTFNLPTASAANRGALSVADFNTFTAKQDAISLTTTGTSGAATLTGATLNIPQYSGGSSTIYKSVTDSASFLSTTNTVVYTQLVDANTFASGDIIRISFRAKKTGTAGAASLRIYVNATANLSGTPLLLGTLASGQTGSRFNQMQRHLVVKSSTNNTETAITTATLATDVINTGDFATISVNWTNALYFVFALQNSSALDTNLGSMYLIEKL